jgi:hypothetical protein
MLFCDVPLSPLPPLAFFLASMNLIILQDYIHSVVASTNRVGGAAGCGNPLRREPATTPPPGGEATC